MIFLSKLTHPQQPNLRVDASPAEAQHNSNHPGSPAHHNLAASGRRGRGVARASLSTFGKLLVLGALFSLGLALWLVWPRSPAAANAQLPALQGQAALDHLKQRGLYDSLGAAITATRYGVRQTAQADVYAAANPAQGFHANFAPAGVELTGADGAAWRLALQLRGVGYGERACRTYSRGVEGSESTCNDTGFRCAQDISNAP